MAIKVKVVAGYLFAGGIHWVPLATVTEPELVVSTIAAHLCPTESSAKPPLTRVIDTIRQQELLLVLDNFEQVSAAAPLVAQLLAACSGLRMLVTSRQPLRLRNEQRFKAPPLAPAAAVELFVTRAQRVHPGFTLTAAQATPVTQLCLHLDCLPLAIELAAAGCNRFTPAELLAQIAHGQLDLGATGSGEWPERHRTLRTAIAWSYQLLNPAAQHLLRALGVFIGTFDWATVSAVFSLPEPILLNQLPALVTSNLLVQHEVDGQRHYSLLETIRTFAIEEAMHHGEWETMRNLHACYFSAWAVTQVPWNFEHGEGFWWRPLEQAHENLRAALQWSLQVDSEQALRLAVALHPFWNTRGYQSEGSRWLSLCRRHTLGAVGHRY